MNEYTKVGWQDGTVLQPAKVTIEGTDYEVDPAVESGTTPVNATNLDKMDTALKQAHDGVRNLSTNKIDKSTIELLTVDSTAPATCSEGDMYYNTTTNLIYTATGTDTWGTTGETPSSKYLYVDLTNSKLYYYDGATFTSYGGGASNDVIISDTEPTDPDVKLWIDTGEVQNVGSELPLVYPVGSIYMSVNNTNPATLFGFGTWERITGGFMYGCVDSYGIGNGTGTSTGASTGNTGSTTLTINQMPAHNHGFGFSTDPNTSGGSSGTGVFAGSGGNQYFGKYLNLTTGNDGGGQGHTHSLNDHTHTIPYVAVFIWKRTA